MSPGGMGGHLGDPSAGGGSDSGGTPLDLRAPVRTPGVAGVPSVVAIGGGHGLAGTLRALRLLPVWPVAVVSVADDGGSTGRLRSDAPRAAPGDIRKCLGALATRRDALTELMEHRFGTGELRGHAFGNLLLAALEESEGPCWRHSGWSRSSWPCTGRCCRPHRPWWTWWRRPPMVPWSRAR
ncbi:MAG: 2-phospho-L-lactate transferase CofD family protein [Microthrixaceae bacterium]|nr:2-phospho-L-lactate transferase CofD family protein [Microthrixaceae bacterium]